MVAWGEGIGRAKGRVQIRVGSFLGSGGYTFFDVVCLHGVILTPRRTSFFYGYGNHTVSSRCGYLLRSAGGDLASARRTLQGRPKS